LEVLVAGLAGSDWQPGRRCVGRQGA
jgi:hypothetical protein